MALYFLEYDLRKQRDYQKLYAELESFSAKRVLESLWCFNRFNTTTSGLRGHFKQFIDNDDGLIVIEASSWASCKTLATPNDL
jgi:hypothetical protein